MIWSLVLIGTLLFLLASTSYLPKRLVSKVEQENEVLQVSELNANDQYFIFVLAAGYEFDPKLPALGQLNLVSLGRLNEAVRIFRFLKKSILVTSGCTFYNTTSQAKVTKNAAIELGVDFESIETLETPSNTLEEARAFSDRFGDVSNLIVVTDAIHMPRALRLFKSLNLTPIAAPTNFKVKFGVNSYNGFTMPKLASLKLFRYWFNEKLKTFIFKFSRE
jgi:uncharacterized SAM-binding protein YcdF (DUF218 family)